MSDLISRQAAIDALNKMKIYRPLDSDRYVISDCLNKIVNLPSVPERKRGRWEEKEVTDDLGAKVITEWQSCKCSVCGKYLTTPYLYYFTDYAYCPCCGAEMEGAEDELV